MLFRVLCMCALLFSAVSQRPARAQTNPIVQENALPGTNSWRLSSAGTVDDITGEIVGYTGQTSARNGEAITFFVSVNPTQTFRIELYRIGWYGGAGGRLMHTSPTLNGVRRAPCNTGTAYAEFGMVECNWPESYRLTVPANWVSGVYLVKLINAANYQTYFPIVIRNDFRRADFLYQFAVLTHAAYNNYPDDNATGKSLYDYNSFGAQLKPGYTRAAKVSLKRPLLPYKHGFIGSTLGEGRSNWEIYFVRWLEKMGYDVTYSTDIDTHRRPNTLKNYRAVLVVGHSEYWTKEMRDAFEAARDSGTHIGNFGANNGYWQVRLEPSTDGLANMTVVCFKEGEGGWTDPIQDPAIRTALFRDNGRAEQSLFGVQYANIANSDKLNGAFVAQNTDHWAFAGTGLTNGATISGIIGNEIDNLNASYPSAYPVSTTYTLLGKSPYTNGKGDFDDAHTVIYRAPSGAWVFSTGTIQWSWGLDRPGFVNAETQQITKNVLDRFIADGKPLPPPEPQPSAVFLPALVRGQ